MDNKDVRAVDLNTPFRTTITMRSNLNTTFKYTPKICDHLSPKDYWLTPTDVYGTALEVGQCVTYVRDDFKGPEDNSGRVVGISYLANTVIVEWKGREPQVSVVGKFIPVLDQSGFGQARFNQLVVTV